jgi:hypothetical protein
MNKKNHDDETRSYNISYSINKYKYMNHNFIDPP